MIVNLSPGTLLESYIMVEPQKSFEVIPGMEPQDLELFLFEAVMKP